MERFADCLPEVEQPVVEIIDAVSSGWEKDSFIIEKKDLSRPAPDGEVGLCKGHPIRLSVDDERTARNIEEGSTGPSRPQAGPLVDLIFAEITETLGVENCEQLR